MKIMNDQVKVATKQIRTALGMMINAMDMQVELQGDDDSAFILDKYRAAACELDLALERM